MFEYKVKCKNKLTWKEIKLYADTDIEEFFNRNSIDYVRNITDTVENRQLQEIERLNNIINELENYTSENIEVLENRLNSPFCNFEKVTKELLIFQNYLDKLKELKEE